MSEISQRVAEMLDMLPEQDQNLAFQLVRRMVLAWDNDFTKLTPAERQRLEIAEQDNANQDTVKHSNIDWDNDSDI
ncbi:MAG: hypothetical protein E7L17_07385 [Clostridium sp.]|uniref:hypothetical protein n=1 Tax=Clostridium sp. TaxID=1506 RepID=UPI002909736C|nr:hypothetical protein [Clostridium sp.]MDU7337919.1 hypothetical protein [Clostridium sp.]